MALYIGGTAVDATAAELNELDGFAGDIVSAFTLGSNDQFAEVAKGTTASQNDSTFVTIYDVDDDNSNRWYMCWITIPHHTGTTGFWVFRQSNHEEAINRGAQEVVDSACSGQWSGDEIQIAQATGQQEPMEYTLYLMHKQ